MIPPRVGLDDENLAAPLRYDAPRDSYWGPPARTWRSFSRMAPRKPDTQWVHFRRVQGQRSRTWGLQLSAPARALCGPPTACTRGVRSSGNVRFALLPVSLSTAQVYRCPLFPRFPPISTVSLITGAIRAARVISACTLARLFLARDRWTARGTASLGTLRGPLRDRGGIALRIGDAFLRPSSRQPQSRRKDGELAIEKGRLLGRAVPPG